MSILVQTERYKKCLFYIFVVMPRFIFISTLMILSGLAGGHGTHFDKI